jgi:acetylornithine/N-succinyldiaminopimelate aminotransferase
MTEDNPMKSSEKIDKWVMSTYARAPITFTKGLACTLWDEDGKEYTDFLAGIAVTNLGHSNPAVAKAVCEQASQLVHVCNLFYTTPQAEVAELLVANSFADQVFFCNSGAEANEGAIKLARLWGKKKLNGAYTIITAKQSFHGRTMAALTATGQEKIQKGFEPLVDGFKYVSYGDLAEAKAAWDEGVCAILIEPVQGEGGVIVPDPEYFQGLKALAQEKGGLLMFDEVQSGLGRTGKLFAYEHCGITPDVMTLAKGLANGLPAGAVCAVKEAAKLMGPGKHGTTFGAGPVIMAAAKVVLETMISPGFMDGVARTGEHLRAKLEELTAKHPDKVDHVRGLGLIQGLVLKAPAIKVYNQLLEAGFVANCTQDVVLRFIPPLVISEAQINAMVNALDGILAGWNME